MATHSEIVKRADQFKISLGNNGKRIFQVTRQDIELDNETCCMLILNEQTAKVLLREEQTKLKGIELANQCISNQIMDPLKTIEQYADILINKSSSRPEIRELLEAIKYCNRMIQYNINDLQDIVNLKNRNFKVKNEWVAVKEVVTETANCNKLQAQRKKQSINIIV